MVMINDRSVIRSILLTSVLGLGALHCGGSSNRGSNMPEGSSGESGGVSSPEATPGVGMGQDPTDSQAGATGSQRNPNDGSSTDASGTAAAPLNDQQIAMITNNVNTAEIEQARIAQSKATNEQVRRFAAMMIEHHTRAKSQQESLGLTTAESPLSMQLEQKSQSTLETLRATSGDEFDRAYMQAQVEGHQQALDTIRQLQPDVQSSELRSYLDNLTPQVQQHLEQARAAQQELQANGARSGSTGMR